MRSYTNQMLWAPEELTALNMVQNADTVLATITIPDGMEFVLQGIITKVNTAAGDTTSAAVKVGKGTSTAFVLLKQTTGIGTSAAVTVRKVDAIKPVTNSGVITDTVFTAGDKLEFRVAVPATSTGKVDLQLLIALANIA